jgi:hypothetical protein
MQFRTAVGERHLTVVLLAALLSLPCVLVGIPSGYDADYHTAYQYHFSRQFWAGDLYPRWLTGANKGYGSPIFLIQYPLPYFVTAFLRPLTGFPADALREARELGVLCFITFVAAGLAARAWFRTYCTDSAATTSAVIYISLPYILGQSLYLRTGLGELGSLVWMPLALALAHRIELTLRSISAMSVVLSLLLLTHLTSAVLFTPLLIGYVVVGDRGMQVPATKRLGAVLLALALGIGLAAVYIVPFVAYRSLFDLDRMRAIIPSFELGRWFPYLTSASLSRRFVIPSLVGVTCFVAVVAIQVGRAPASRLYRAGMVATLLLGISMMIPDLGPSLIRGSGLTVSSFDTAGDFSARMLFTGLATVALGFLGFSYASPFATPREKLLLAVACTSFLLMLPWSAPVWSTWRALGSIQFPFRLGAILTVAVAGLCAAAIDESLQQWGRPGAIRRAVLPCMAGVVVIALGALTWRVPGRFMQPSTTDQAIAHNVDNMFRSYVGPEYVARFAQKLGASLDSFDVRLTAVDDSVRGKVIRTEPFGGRCETQVVPLEPRVIHVSARCRQDGHVVIGQVYSPLWRVRSTNQASRESSHWALTSSSDGLIELRVNGGEHELDLEFGRHWPEQLGTILSMGSLGVVLVGFVSVIKQ